MKTCPICGIEFERGDKFQVYCIPGGDCYLEANRRRSKKWYYEHKGQAKKTNRIWHQANYKRTKEEPPRKIVVGHHNPVVWDLSQIQHSSPEKLAAALSDPRGFRVAGGTR